jgi:hypothetical protein
MHFCLYMPLLSYLLLICCFRCRCFRKVLLVLKVILVSVYLNILAVCCLVSKKYEYNPFISLVGIFFGVILVRYNVVLV